MSTAELLAAKGPTPDSWWSWARVDSLAPLRVVLDGETVALAITPEDHVGGLAVGNRVRMHFHYGRAYVTSKPGGQTDRPNIIINGDFRTNQRGTGSGATIASNAYALDRWKNSVGSTTTGITWSGTDDTGRTLTLGSPSVGASVAQVVERRNIKAGTYALSWSGTAVGRVYNEGAPAPTPQNSPYMATVDGTTNLVVELYGEGHTVSRVKLESGPVATPFQTTDYSEELLKCQRYFVKWTATTTEEAIGAGMQTGSTTATFLVPLPTSMRVVPTVTLSGVNVTDRTSYSTAVTGITRAVGARPGQAAVALDITNASSGATYRPAILQLQAAGSTITFDAEL